MERKTDIELWAMPNAGFRTKETIEQELALFSKEHPDIRVNYKIISWSSGWKKIVRAIKSKSGPDVLQIGNSWTATLTYLGGLRDISSEVEMIDWRERSSPSVWLSCTADDKSIRAVPWFSDFRVLFYRKDILEKVGLNKDDLDTWDSFKKTCSKINNLEVNGKLISALGISGQKETVLSHDLAPWIWSAGSNFLSVEGSTTLINSPEALEGILFYLNLVGSGYVSSWALHQNMSGLTEEFFIKDKYALYFSSISSLLTYLNPQSKSFIGKRSDDYGIALFPRGPKGRYTFLGGSNLCITSFSERPKESWELIKFLASFDSQTRYYKNIQVFPAYIESFDFSFLNSETREAILKSYEIGRIYPRHFLWRNIEQTITSWLAINLKEIITSNYDTNKLKNNIKNLSKEINWLLSMYKNPHC